MAALLRSKSSLEQVLGYYILRFVNLIKRLPATHENKKSIPTLPSTRMVTKTQLHSYKYLLMLIRVNFLPTAKHFKNLPPYHKAQEQGRNLILLVTQCYIQTHSCKILNFVSKLIQSNTVRCNKIQQKSILGEKW